MSTSSMGWQPVVEAPGSKLAEAMAMRLLEQKIQSPEDEWRRQLAERQFGLQEREAESRMGLGERAAGLEEKQFGLQKEKFGEEIWKTGMDITQKGREQDIHERGVVATEAYHAGQLELQKMQKEDMAKWRDKKLELEGIDLDLKKQQIQGTLDFRQNKLSMEGVEHAREVMKEGMRILSDPVAQAMMQRTPGMRDQLEERVQWATGYLSRAQSGGVLQKAEGLGRQPSPVRQALGGAGVKPVGARAGEPSQVRQVLEDAKSRGLISDTTYNKAKGLSDQQLEAFLARMQAYKQGGH